ncbi:MAG: phosphate ABC transporter ATP-binding protein PstB [Propionibacteriaceae bacterium]|jgi:phosphate transport system ATP-binding protein|nr:phosphate ABC transporter ATP-binding protein PstB [Propionibacteriaceae bacterium]
MTIEIENLNAYYEGLQAVSDVSMSIPERAVTALIGPSGCGKSTLLRCINRMHEIVPGARVGGGVRLDGADLYAADADPVEVRARVGMVFQRPNPFPTMSIAENVLAGFRLRGERLSKADSESVIERALHSANLWDEVKDRLKRAGTSLSGGQQQRLCIARALASRPDVLLMDEPCSALDPASTQAIEDLIAMLRAEHTVVIVTHNLPQAARVADRVAFMATTETGDGGHLIEYGTTDEMFNHPVRSATQDYIAGRFG